jgi:hypothetical protein
LQVSSWMIFFFFFLLLSFFSLLFAFGTKLRMVFHTPSSFQYYKYHLFSSFSIFMISCFTCKSFSHLEFILMSAVTLGSNLFIYFFLMVSFPCVGILNVAQPSKLHKS